MAFSQGDPITASGLNSINAKAWASQYIGSGGDWTSRKFFSHVPAGKPLFKVRLDCGWFGGGGARITKLDASGNVIATLLDTTWGWNTHTNVVVNSTGPGWYNVVRKDNWSFDATTVYFYAYQTDCAVGNYLTLWDTPTVSGNRRTGTPLTVDELNSGLGGTFLN